MAILFFSSDFTQAIQVFEDTGARALCFKNFHCTVRIFLMQLADINKHLVWYFLSLCAFAFRSGK